MANTGKILYPASLKNLSDLQRLGQTPFVPKQCGANLRFIFQESSNPRNREVLRRAFGNSGIQFKNGTVLYPQFQGEQKSGITKLTPFRVAFNAGDTNGTFNASPDSTLVHRGSNQINLPNNPGAGDGTNTQSGGSYYSGNPRFVYDGSDYTKYKKLAAVNKNYKDITFGGDQYNGSVPAYRRVTNR